MKEKTMSLYPTRKAWSWPSRSIGAAVGVLFLCTVASAAVAQMPVTLTDKIRQGQGTINLLRDIGPSALGSLLDANGNLLFAVDLNEDLGGYESKDSIGVAIKDMRLLITTTAGSYTFGDFFTSTTAMILESGAADAREFYTLFGRAGSSQITGRTGDAALDNYDDVVQVRNISLSGDILSATLSVQFLNTARTGSQTVEGFFDFSDGFEDFAIIGQRQAAELETAAYGMDSVPTALVYSDTGSVVPLNTAPGTPAPPLLVMGVLAACIALRKHHAPH